MSQINVNVVKLFNKLNTPFTFMWDGRSFTVPPKGYGVLDCVEAVAWHGVKHSQYMLNPVTGHAEYQLGISGIHDMNEEVPERGNELMDRKAIEEVEGPSATVEFANPIKKELPQPAAPLLSGESRVTFESVPEDVPDSNMVSDTLKVG